MIVLRFLQVVDPRHTLNDVLYAKMESGERIRNDETQTAIQLLDIDQT